MALGFGKMILLGEHGVVHGRPALAAALSKGCRAIAVVAQAPILEVAPWGVRVQPGDGGEHEALARAFAALLDGYATRPALHITAQMEIPGGAGLGGSAALSVAVIRAIDETLGIERDDAAVAELALSAERVFHGDPSGVDSAMAAAGGVAMFRKGEALAPVRVKRPAWFVIGHSGQPSSTKETVASVARQHSQDPAKVDKIFDGMEAIVNNGRTELAEGKLDRFGQLMDLNQKLLNSLMLSTGRLEELCGSAAAHGALGAKLTGGGGGGCMIALATDELAADGIRQALAALGSEAITVKVGP